MEKRPRSLLLKFPGTNCDGETARALETAGFAPVVQTVAEIDESTFTGFDLVVFSGGFSYGDYVMSGRFASLITRQKTGDALKAFRDRGGYILGICNGFQILTQLGLLPEGSLVENTSGRFECRWVKLNNRKKESPFLRNLPLQFELPVANAEGRFVGNTEEQVGGYLEDGTAVLTYVDDINGSYANIAGLQDASGRVLGMMPHPERFLHREHHYDPDWDGDEKWGTGYYLFQSIYQTITQPEG